MKEKPWKWKQGIPLAQLNKRSKGEKLCEIILHLELSLHLNSIYVWMIDGDQLKGSELQSPPLLLLYKKIQSWQSKYSLKIPPSAQFLLYSNFMFMQFQFVKDALSFMTTIQRKQYFIWRTCLHFKIQEHQRWSSRRENLFAPANVFKQRELCLLSILILD